MNVDMSVKDHWEKIYSTKPDSEVSWTEPDPRTSLSLIRELCPSGRIIDVGGGTSVLTDRLLDAGYSVAVLDISEAALARARERLGTRADQVRWIFADVTAAPDLGMFDLWHDRAVFHFLTDPADRAAYIALLSRTIPVGGHVVIATFAPDGPEQCSGLPIQRYDGDSLARKLNGGFALLKSVPETHLTPWGNPQSFQYSVFKRVKESARGQLCVG
jgi:SAM-dependent methyltransferase